MNAAGILPVMTTAAADHSAEDMGDLIEYAFGNGEYSTAFLIGHACAIYYQRSVTIVCGLQKQPNGARCVTKTITLSPTTLRGSS